MARDATLRDASLRSYGQLRCSCPLVARQGHGLSQHDRSLHLTYDGALAPATGQSGLGRRPGAVYRELENERRIAIIRGVLRLPSDLVRCLTDPSC